MERVRMALFERLQHLMELEQAIVADLFAGTGILGLEALSRGAAYCIFVERNRRLTDALRHALSTLDVLPEQYRILTDDVFRVVPLWQRLELPRPHLLLADPPYRTGLGARLLQALARAEWLLPGGWLCLELSRREAIASIPEGWELHSERLFGDTRVQWYRYGVPHATSSLPGHL